MREWLGQLSVFTWLVSLSCAIYATGKLLDRLQRPKPRTSIRWPDRSRNLQRPVVRSRSAAGGELEPDPPSAASVNDMRRLLLVTLHDRVAVERLIDYEKQQRPGISRDEAISRAYQSWVQDNRLSQLPLVTQ